MIEVGGYYHSLTEALRELGVRADNVDVGVHPFQYERVLDRPWPLIAVERIALRRESHRRDHRRWRFVAWTVIHRLALLFLLAWSLPRYDAYVFGFGVTFAGTYDLRLLRYCRKRIVMIYHGSDVRPAYMDGADMDPKLGRTATDALALTRRKQVRLARAERYADVIVSHPLYSQLLARRCVSYLAIGVPMRPQNAQPAAPRTARGLRVLHAPSNPSVKGTDLIRKAVEQLNAEGYGLEYREIVGRPNAEVLAAIAESDLVVDQAYSDLPYSIFGAEAAARGKCVVVAGYGRRWLEQCLGEMPPLQWAEPEAMADAIREVVIDAALRSAIGLAAKEYLRDWEPIRVGDRLLRLISGDIDSSWLFDPADYAYVLGAGMPRSSVIPLVREVVAFGGNAGLGVGHNPKLQDALLELVSSTPPGHVYQ